VTLLAECAEYNNTFGEMAAEGIILNEYIIAGRYPDDISIEDIGQTEAVEALAVVHKIRECVLDLIESNQDSSE
jgi:hypothetical protein